MAAPVIAWSGEAVSSGDAVTFAVANQPTWAAGDLCLVWVATDGDNTFDVPNSGFNFNIAWGLTLLGQYSNGTASFGGLLYRRMTGAETGELIIYENETSETMYAVLMQITGGIDEPILAPISTGTNNAPNPLPVPALQVAHDCLYIACVAWDHNDTYSSSPTNYTAVQNGNSGSGSGDCGGAVAQRTLTASSAAEDPGAFGLSGSEEWVSDTVCILGAATDELQLKYPHSAAGAYTSFGKTTGNRYYGCSCKLRSTAALSTFDTFVGALGTPVDDLEVALQADSSGAPSGSDLAVSGAVNVTTSQWYTFTFSSPPTLTAGTTYWIVVRRTGSLSDANYYQYGYLNPASSNDIFPTRYWDGSSWTSLVTQVMYYLKGSSPSIIPRIGMAPKVAP